MSTMAELGYESKTRLARRLTVAKVARICQAARSNSIFRTPAPTPAAPALGRLPPRLLLTRYRVNREFLRFPLPSQFAIGRLFRLFRIWGLYKFPMAPCRSTSGVTVTSTPCDANKWKANCPRYRNLFFSSVLDRRCDLRPILLLVLLLYDIPTPQKFPVKETRLVGAQIMIAPEDDQCVKAVVRREK